MEGKGFVLGQTWEQITSLSYICVTVSKIPTLSKHLFLVLLNGNNKTHVKVLLWADVSKVLEMEQALD